MIPNDEEIVAEVKALKYPTPFFYTKRDILKHNYQTFTNLFDNEEVYFALKSNSEPEILTYLDQLGAGFEAASSYEIDILMNLGIDSKKIIYGTSIKPIEHIQHAVKAGIDRFAADSREEIEKIAKYAPGSRVLVRASVDDAGSVFRFSERFGAPPEELFDLVMYAKKLGLKTYGISFHVGSQATKPYRWAKAIEAVRPAIEELYKKGVKLDVLDIGGGFPVPYENHHEIPHLSEIVITVNNSIHQLPYAIKLVMEPGRGIVATSTVLVTEVISRATRHGKTWLCLDAGIYNALFEAMIHQGATQYIMHPLTGDHSKSKKVKCMLTGPTGDSLDIVARNIELPDSIGLGDRLAFTNSGAYTIVMSCPFNGFPKPALYIN